MKKEVDFTTFRWMNEPQYKIVKDHQAIISSDPFTDLWSKKDKYIHDNASILYFENEEDFTVSFKVTYNYSQKYDQCGLVVYVTEDCWFKICMEFENDVASRLVSAVTFNGYTDWTNSGISSYIDFMYFRLNHRNFNFVAEYSFDGKNYKHLRGFHMDPLGQRLKVGVFVASLKDSSFDAKFEEFMIDEYLWEEYEEK